MGGTQLPKKRLLAESKCALFRLHLLEIKTPFPFLRLQNEHIPHVKKKTNRPGGAGRRSRGGAPLGPGAEPPVLGVFHMHVARHTSPKWGIASRTLFCPRVFALGSTTGDSHRSWPLRVTPCVRPTRHPQALLASPACPERPHGARHPCVHAGTLPHAAERFLCAGLSVLVRPFP